MAPSTHSQHLSNTSSNLLSSVWSSSANSDLCTSSSSLMPSCTSNSATIPGTSTIPTANSSAHPRTTSASGLPNITLSLPTIPAMSSASSPPSPCPIPSSTLDSTHMSSQLTSNSTATSMPAIPTLAMPSFLPHQPSLDPSTAFSLSSSHASSTLNAAMEGFFVGSAMGLYTPSSSHSPTKTTSATHMNISVTSNTTATGATTIPNAITSSVSSPSAPDSDCSAEVDDLLEGIERIRNDDLWITPRSSRTFHTDSYAALFAPPSSRFPMMVSPSAPMSAPPVGDTIASSFGRSLDRAVMHPSPPNSASSFIHADPDIDFPRLFKVYVCPHLSRCEQQDNISECFYYHDARVDRRRINVAMYKPHMCRFVDDPSGCRKGDRCPFSHNDFERRYHPDRFGKETCRDFLRSECPRRYCTFRHQVSQKVEVALTEMHCMSDKEMLQLVLKMDEDRGRSLCDKLLRRFGHGKKHSGWKLEGFSQSKDDACLKEVSGRVDHVKRRLRGAGEKKWAASLKTCSLRDMMSGVRKVAEEMRERCRLDDRYVENGASEIHRLIRAVFSNTNWSCHSMDGDNPFLVTPDNQHDALAALERLVAIVVEAHAHAHSLHADGVSNVDQQSGLASNVGSTKPWINHTHVVGTGSGHRSQLTA